eukprot:3475677-Pyramimonas_sp.AAC.1
MLNNGSHNVLKTALSRETASPCTQESRSRVELPRNLLRRPQHSGITLPLWIFSRLTWKSRHH